MRPFFNYSYIPYLSGLISPKASALIEIAADYKPIFPLIAERTGITEASNL